MGPCWFWGACKGLTSCGREMFQVRTMQIRCCRFNSLSNAFPALATPTAQTPAPEFQGRTMKNIAACCMSNVSSTLSQRFARTEVVGESWITPSSCVIKDLGTCMIQIHYIILYCIVLYYIIFTLYTVYIYIIYTHIILGFIYIYI